MSIFYKSLFGSPFIPLELNCQLQFYSMLSRTQDSGPNSDNYNYRNMNLYIMY